MALVEVLPAVCTRSVKLRGSVQAMATTPFDPGTHWMAWTTCRQLAAAVSQNATGRGRGRGRGRTECMHR
eukprot:scaffold19072_cov30-Prasinocladus_malaysianus.AAC.1